MASRQTKRRRKRKGVARTKRQRSLRTLRWWNERRNWYIIGGLLLITFLVYTPTFNNEFLNWDDDGYVTENELITGLSENWNEIWSLSSPPVVGNYHPLTVVSLALNYEMSGLDISSYHWTNILLHLLNALLVFAFIMQITGNKTIVAAVTAGIFGLHPMHVESVSWIAERKDVLYTLFFLLSMMAYVHFTRRKHPGFYLAAFVAFVLACLSKPAAVVLPAVLLALDFYLFKNLKWKMLWDKIPFFIVSVIIGRITMSMQEASNAVGDFAAFSFFERISFASYGFVMYIVRFFIPYKQSAFYPYPHPITEIPSYFHLMPVLVLLIAAIAIWSLRKTKVVAFGLLFYAITVALVLQFISVGDALLADRYTYVPYIGLAFILGYGLHALLEKSSKKYQSYQYLALISLLLWSLIMAFLAHERTKVWKNNEVFWTDVVTKYPHSVVAWNNRGHHYRQLSGEAQDPAVKNALLDQALHDYNQALHYNPKYGLSWSNKGKVFFEKKEYQKAIEAYNKALSFNPNRAIDYVNRGASYSLTGNYDQAMQDFARAIEIDTDNINAYQNRGITHNQLGNYQAAIADFTEVLNRRPGFAGLYINRGLAYYQLGQKDQTLRDFSLAIQWSGNTLSKGGFLLQRSRLYKELNQYQNAYQDAIAAQQLGVKVEQEYLASLKR